MRIAFISSTFDYRHRRRLAIVAGLRSIGHLCKVFAISYPDQDVVFPTDISPVFASERSPFRISNALRVRRIQKKIIGQMQAFQPDCVVAMDPDTLFAGVYFKKNFGKWFIYDVQEFHGHTTLADNAHRSWVERKEKQASKYIDQALVLSESMKNFMHRKLGNVPIGILSNAISGWKSAPYNGHLHRTNQLSTQTKILLYHGYFVPYRGLEWLADFSQKLPKPWHTVMMGWGPLFNDLKAKTSSELSVIDGVPPEHLIKTISGANIGAVLYDPVNLNHQYSTPNKLYEYPAAGIPILSENLSEIAKPVLKYDMGWVVNKSNNTDLILKIFSPGNMANVLQKANNCEKFLDDVSIQSDPNYWKHYFKDLE